MRQVHATRKVGNSLLSRGKRLAIWDHRLKCGLRNGGRLRNLGRATDVRTRTAATAGAQARGVGCTADRGPPKDAPVPVAALDSQGSARERSSDIQPRRTASNDQPGWRGRRVRGRACWSAPRRLEGPHVQAADEERSRVHCEASSALGEIRYQCQRSSLARGG